MQNMEFIEKLTIPKELMERFPITEEMRGIKQERDAEFADVFSGYRN